MKDRRSRRDDERDQNAITASGTEAQDAATCKEGEDIRQDLQEDRRAGDRKANGRVFDWATGNE
jgi:hypothetical protein